MCEIRVCIRFGCILELSHNRNHYLVSVLLLEWYEDLLEAKKMRRKSEKKRILYK